MNLNLPIKANPFQASTTKAHQPAVDRHVTEPGLVDVQQFELKTAQLQQAQAVQSDKATTDKIVTDEGLSVSEAAKKEAGKDASLMEVFHKQLADSILKDIITKCKIEIDKD